MATWTTTSGLINWADWYMPTDSTNYNGVYKLEAYVSTGTQPHTAEAIYWMYANGHAGGVSRVQILDQAANQGGFCYIFGPNLSMNGTNGGFAEIRDHNTRGDGYIYVDIFCFDAQ